jgi:hypothetical protein
MKKLPLLSSSFKTFSWTTPIGNATATQLQNSYNALINKGETPEFSIKVWNDLVELLYQAIIQSGHSWDSTYGSVSNTKMMFPYDELTSFRFNAMTWNITKLINLTWKWEVDTDLEGFVGRLRFYGVSEVRGNADYLYGWYILELARVINLFINILKNQADFGELSSKTIIPMVDYCDVHSCNARAAQYETIINSLSEIIARTGESVPLSLHSLSKTLSEVSVRNLQGKPVSHEDIVKSLSYVKMAALTVRRMYHSNIVNVISYAKAYSRDAMPIDLKEDVVDSPNDCIVVNPQGMPMSHEYEVNVIDFMNVVGAYPKYFKHENMIHSIDSVVVSNSYPKYIQDNEISHSISEVNVRNKEGLRIGLEEISNTIDELKVTLKKPSKVIADEVIKTISYFKLSVESTWLYPIKNGTNLYIRQVYSSEQKGNELFIDNDTWLEPVQNGTDLYIRQMYDELEKE